MTVFDKEKVAERLRAAVKMAGGNKRISEKANVPLSTLNGYIGGKAIPTFHSITELAAACDVSLDWLAYNADISSDGPNISSDALYSIPRYDVEASAGNGALVEVENVEDHFTVSKDWLAKIAPNDAKVGIIEARGDSMEPTIQDGDIMMINFNITSKHVSVGGVFVISVNGNLLVKRLQVMTSGDIKVISDNDLYEPELISAEFLDESVTVHAQVIWSGGKIRRR